MVEGLKEAIKIIDNEVEFAREVNPVMVAGMYQIKQLLEERINKEKEGVLDEK